MARPPQGDGNGGVVSTRFGLCVAIGRKSSITESLQDDRTIMSVNQFTVHRVVANKHHRIAWLTSTFSESPSSHLSAPQALIIDGSFFAAFIWPWKMFWWVSFFGVRFFYLLHKLTISLCCCCAPVNWIPLDEFPVGILSPGCALKKSWLAFTTRQNNLKVRQLKISL